MKVTNRLTWPARQLLLVAALLGTACGGGDTPLEPENDPALAPFVGEWTALSMVVRSDANPDVAPDLIQEGATFNLNVQASGQYTASLIFQLQVSTEIGFLSVSGNTVTLRRDFPTRTTSTPAALRPFTRPSARPGEEGRLSSPTTMRGVRSDSVRRARVPKALPTASDTVASRS